jgi:hypothetical protein
VVVEVVDEVEKVVVEVADVEDAEVDAEGRTLTMRRDLKRTKIVM